MSESSRKTPGTDLTPSGLIFPQRDQRKRQNVFPNLTKGKNFPRLRQERGKKPPGLRRAGMKTAPAQAAGISDGARLPGRRRP
ncbi:hypothetical protein ASZ90_002995 [hydrocarbon metagenome]|uniref:Uncharacterized protein n=1 Tax=hydrocarbon metagenome TaxID=938273 RepID=A0A0W8G298_9ZZZZ